MRKKREREGQGSQERVGSKLRGKMFVRSNGKGKGKAIPLQAWKGPEGFRRLMLPDFKTVGT